MTARPSLLARITAFVLRGRRARLDHPDAHRAARPDQHAGLAMHYRPSSSGVPGASGFRN